MNTCCNILVIDDDPAIRETLSVIIKTMGYKPVCAGSGNEGLDRLYNEHFDLVILDVMMPEMDGWEVLKIIRDDPALETTRVVLLTAKSSDRDKLIGQKILKADEYISKPFDLSNFKEIVERVVRM